MCKSFLKGNPAPWDIQIIVVPIRQMVLPSSNWEELEIRLSCNTGHFFMFWTSSWEHQSVWIIIKSLSWYIGLPHRYHHHQHMLYTPETKYARCTHFSCIQFYSISHIILQVPCNNFNWTFIRISLWWMLFIKLNHYVHAWFMVLTCVIYHHLEHQHVLLPLPILLSWHGLSLLMDFFFPLKSILWAYCGHIIVGIVVYRRYNQGTKEGFFSHYCGHISQQETQGFHFVACWSFVSQQLIF